MINDCQKTGVRNKSLKKSFLLIITASDYFFINKDL